jgi:hypothetical protein
MTAVAPFRGVARAEIISKHQSPLKLVIAKLEYFYVGIKADDDIHMMVRSRDFSESKGDTKP